MSGLKINYLKSEIFVVGADNGVSRFYSELFGCVVSTLPMKYLGVLVSFDALKTIDCEFLVGKMIRGVDASKGHLHLGAGLFWSILVCLVSFPLSCLCFC